VIAQGSKELVVGDDHLRYDPAHYMISTVELPMIGQIVEESPERPYLGLWLALDPTVIWNWIYKADILERDVRWYEKNIMGTGPFVFVEHVKGSRWVADETRSTGTAANHISTPTRALPL
jgi:hypothetical protein